MTTETVKIVNGLKIERYAGTRGAYFVTIREGKGWQEFNTFKSARKAEQFIKDVFPHGLEVMPPIYEINGKFYR